MGSLGDRIGPRRVLTRIVLWWSSFTALTGAATALLPAAVDPLLFRHGRSGRVAKCRGFSEEGLLSSALPCVVGACANLGGGAASDALVRGFGLKKGRRRALGAASLAFAGLLTTAAMLTRQPMLTVALLSLVYSAIVFQQSGVFGVCLDIGGKHAGAMVGMMNTSAQVGGLLASVLYGYIVERFGSYEAPFVPMAGLLSLGALTWLKIDASAELSARPRISPAPLLV